MGKHGLSSAAHEGKGTGKNQHIWPGLDAHQQEKGPTVGCSHDETFYGSENMWMPAACNLDRSWECTTCQRDAISYKAWKDSRVNNLLLRRTWLYAMSWQTYMTGSWALWTVQPLSQLLSSTAVVWKEPEKIYNVLYTEFKWGLTQVGGVGRVLRDM